MLTYLLPLLALSFAWANPLPQATTPTPSSALATASARAMSSASNPLETTPYGILPFGLKYKDPEGGKRIHPYGREDLCVQVKNETLVPGALVQVARCLNNSAPLPGQRNLFNLTTLNITANYTGLIAPVNQTTLCLSGNWHIPKNKTDYATEKDREITLQPCNSTDVKQIWRYGLDDTVRNASGRAYKLSLSNQTQCATILSDNRVQPRFLIFSMYPCGPTYPSQPLMVVNGTSTPNGTIPGLAIPLRGPAFYP